MTIRFSTTAVLALLVGCLFIFSPSDVLAKSTSDPNHKGWSGKHPTSKQVDWKPIKVKCKQCTKMMEQYNETMQRLLVSRYWVNFWREVHKNREKGKADPFWPGKKDTDITEFEGRAVGANLELFELQSQQLELHKKLVTALEQQSSYLRGAISQCEKTACKDSKPTKIKAIKIGGEKTSQPFQPDINSILPMYDIDWKGPYSTNCAPCRKHVLELNALPGWVVRAHMQLQYLESQLSYAELVDRSNKVELDFLKYRHPEETDFSGLKAKIAKVKQELAAYTRYFKTLLVRLPQCEKQYCPVKKISYLPEPSDDLISIGEDFGLRNCSMTDASAPIIVGTNAEVGSGKEFKDKAKSKVMGFAAGALGFGGGGSKKKSDGPPTTKDPIKKKYKITTELDDGDYELVTGAKFTDDGLLVSTHIKDAIGNGTFQQIYLVNPRGWRLEPVDLFMFKIWSEWRLSVSWTRDTYVNGEHVRHEEGGWNEFWTEDIAEGVVRGFRAVPEEADPIWKQLGFGTASSGARSVGTLFPVSSEMLAAEPLDLVVHITNPKSDPVDTHPIILRLSLDEKERVVTEYTGQTQASALMAQNPLFEKVSCGNGPNADEKLTENSTDEQPDEA